MKKTWKKAVLTVVTASIVSTAPVIPALAESDNGGGSLAGFSLLFDEYLNSSTEENQQEDGTTALLSTGFTIPENIAIANVIDSCNIRAGAGTNYDIIGIFPKNAYCIVSEVKDGWAKIKSGNVSGYIKTDYLFLGDEGYQKAAELAQLTATVTAGTVNVRTEPSTKSDDTIIMEVTKGEQLDVVEDGILNKNDEKAQLWVKVIVDSTDMTETDGDSYGYISSEFVDIGFHWKTAVKIDPISASVSSIRRQVVAEAKKHIGLKYVWGGTSLKTGADCSGFCRAVYQACGISLKKLPRTSYDLASSSAGKTVSLANAKPGDLVFYGDTRGNVNHVAIYIGNNQVIHESGRKEGCKISKVNYRTIIKIKNFIDYIY